MDYMKIFSYCLKNETPDSEHQFHYQKDNEPSLVDWNNWIANSFYASIQHFATDRQVYLGSYKDKKNQIRAFLDYHYQKYDDVCFIDEVKDLMQALERGLITAHDLKGQPIDIAKLYPKIVPFVNNIALDWCKEKETASKELIEKKMAQHITLKHSCKFESYISGDERQKAKIISRLPSLLNNAKGNRIASVLLALQSINCISLPDRGRTKIYAALEDEFGLSNIQSGTNDALKKYKNGHGNITNEDIERLAEILKAD